MRFTADRVLGPRGASRHALIARASVDSRGMWCGGSVLAAAKLARLAMPRVQEVFTPTDVPTFSYVIRSTQKFEERLRHDVSIPNMIVSLSGPSKSGKTSLVKKVLERDELIHVYGASIRSPEDLWDRVLNWMEVPDETVETRGTALKAEAGGKAGGSAGLPFLAKGRAEVEGKFGGERRSEVRDTYHRGGLARVVREIGGSTYTIFVDDFHYIPKDVQREIGKQIKEAAESGVRIISGGFKGSVRNSISDPAIL
jgi:hypothetical protein